MSSTSLFAALAARAGFRKLVGDEEPNADALLGEIDALAARLHATQVSACWPTTCRWAIADLAVRAQAPVLPLPTCPRWRSWRMRSIKLVPISS